MLHVSAFAMLLLLFAAHALADYPLQGEFIANGKNPNTEVGKVLWRHLLIAHGLIHAGFVCLITGSVVLGLLEFFIHTFTDWLKCNNEITYDTDQAIHYSCKVLWWLIVLVLWGT